MVNDMLKRWCRGQSQQGRASLKCLTEGSRYAAVDLVGRERQIRHSPR